MLGPISAWTKLKIMSRVLTNPKQGPRKTTVPLKGGYVGFLVRTAEGALVLQIQSWKCVGFQTFRVRNFGVDDGGLVPNQRV